MISTSDGSLPEDQAKAFAKQYAEELHQEQKAKIDYNLDSLYSTWKTKR